ncbi:helix-turn-helix domain-containing protein [Streptomyces sp. NBC_01201]|uniref:helix-turn-helix domain-containing protein n=1 Tax=unclassified Streptomyces TaxID=2593676 RepID=UPI002E0E00BF|nr:MULTISPECIES: helix-turn-helix transcriptional regulator [unclassified Streptomyces]WSR09388.1 helix-turn-helix domain-containing protein [Streptomyces sp. NBC_01208]WSR47884.1 helix-turn-helix domain-containing protein [Streptomyces sp. NBC_01201]
MPLRRTPLPEWAVARRRDLGQRLATARRNAGLSQEQLGNLVGVERRTIQRYESGERDPRFTDLLLIADALGIDLAYLVRT